jgi:DNA-binding transcriptional ArsR family regulator
MASDVDEPGLGDIDLPAVLAALADRGRLISVRALALTGEANCTAIVELTGLGVSKSTMSHHLRVLRQAGITHTRAAGAHRYVSLRREELEARFPGLLDAVLSVAADGLDCRSGSGGRPPAGTDGRGRTGPDGSGADGSDGTRLRRR